MNNECQHNRMTSTHERGVYCCRCNEPLAGFFRPVSRNTPGGAVLHYLLNASAPREQRHE